MREMSLSNSTNEPLHLPLLDSVTDGHIPRNDTSGRRFAHNPLRWPDFAGWKTYTVQLDDGSIWTASSSGWICVRGPR